MAVVYEPESAKFVIQFAKDRETFTEINPEVDDETLASFYVTAFSIYEDTAETASKVITYRMKTEA